MQMVHHFMKLTILSDYDVVAEPNLIELICSQFS